MLKTCSSPFSEITLITNAIVCNHAYHPFGLIDIYTVFIFAISRLVWISLPDRVIVSPLTPIFVILFTNCHQWLEADIMCQIYGKCFEAHAKDAELVAMLNNSTYHSVLLGLSVSQPVMAACGCVVTPLADAGILEQRRRCTCWEHLLGSLSVLLSFLPSFSPPLVSSPLSPIRHRLSSASISPSICPLHPHHHRLSSVFLHHSIPCFLASSTLPNSQAWNQRSTANSSPRCCSTLHNAAISAWNHQDMARTTLSAWYISPGKALLKLSLPWL